LANAVANRDAATLVGVVDIVAERGESLAEEHGVTAYANHERALAGANPDAAIVAVPPSSHASVATDCLDAQVHVYLEKPAGDIERPEEVLELSERAAANRVVLMPGYSQRYQPYAETAIELVREGAIGAVESIDVLRQTDWSPDPQPAPGWGIHDYNVCCLIASSPPDAIHPYSTTVDGTADPATTEVIVKHENGVLSRCRTHTSAEELDIVLRVHGEDGDVVADRVNQRIRVVTPEREWTTEFDESPPFEARALDAFFETVVSGQEPPVTAAEVVRGRRIEAAVYDELDIEA
jgi:predicted dehydrogenase